MENPYGMHEEYEDLGTFSLPDSDNNASSIRILQLTDLHCFPKDCLEFENIPLLDSHARCMEFVDTLVREVRPDVIVLTGDIMDGRGPWKSRASVVDTLQDLLPHFHDTPWAFIPGNHDHEHGPWGRADLLKLFQLPGCLQKQARGFHHTLLLTKVNTTIKVRLHLFDSGGDHPNAKIMYYCTPKKAIQSFEQWAGEKGGTEPDVTGLCYIHIPTPEFQGLDPIVGQNNLFEAALVAGKVPRPWNHFVWLIKLLKKDRIAGCTRGPDSGLFPALCRANDKDSVNITAVFCGHDHHSDAIFFRQDIFLGYGRSATFTPPWDWEGKSPNPLQQGVRVVDVASDGIIKTWVHTLQGAEPNSLLDMTSYDPVKHNRRWFC